MIAAWPFAIRNCGVLVYNLGTGCGYSVLDLVHAFEQAGGVAIPYVIEARRPGDVAVCYSDTSKANRELLIPYYKFAYF